MFILTNILIAFVWCFTDLTIFSYGMLHIVTLIITLPAYAAVVMVGEQRKGQMTDLALTVLFSLFIAYMVS